MSSPPISFFEEASRMKAERDAEVNGSIDLATRQDPAKAVQALEAGVPVDFDDQALAEINRQLRVGNLPLDQLGSSEALRRFFSDPTRATAGLADMKPLADFASALTQPSGPKAPIGDVLGGRFERGQAMIKRADAGYALILSDTEQNRLDLTRANEIIGFADVPEGGGFAEFVGPAVEMLPLLKEQLGAGLVGAGVGAGTFAGGTLILGQLGPQAAVPEELLSVPAAAVSGAVTGGKVGASFRIFQIEAGNAMADFMDLRDADGNELDPMALRGAAVAVGAINGSLELISLGALLKIVPGGKKILGAGSAAGVRQAMKEGLRSSGALRSIMSRIGRDYAGAVVIEGTTETVQSIVNSTASNALEVAFGTGESLLPSSEQTGQALSEGLEALKASIVLGGVSGTLTVGQEIALAQLQTAHEQQQLALMERAVKETKLRESAPEVFGELVDAVAEEAGAEGVFVPAQAIQEQIEQGQIRLEEFPAEIRNRLDEAVTTGADVALPLGSYFRMPDAVRQALSQEARLAPESLTAQESRELSRVLEQRLEQGIPEGEPTPAPVADLSQALPELAAPEARTLEDARARVAAEAEAVRTLRQERALRDRDAAEKARRKQVEAEQKRIRPEVESEISSRKSWRLRSWLTDGQLTHEEDLRKLSGLRHQKLDRDALIDRYGPEIVSELPQRALVRGGIDPDLVSDLWGFASADDMVLELIETKPGLPATVRQETALRAQNVAGPEVELDAVPEGKLESALEELMAAEEVILARRAQTTTLPRKVLRAAADRLIGAKPIRELRPAQYRVSTSRQAVAAIAAAKEGNADAALVAKRRQLLNHFMDLAARKRRRQANQDVKAIRKLLTPQSLRRVGLAEGTFREQMEALAQRFELRRSLRSLERTQSLAEWIRDQEEAGETVVIPRELRQEAQGLARRTHWRNLTPDELAGLRRSLENIAHLAKRKNEFRSHQQQRARDAIASKLIEEAEQNIVRDAGFASMRGDLLERMRAFTQKVDAELSQTEAIADALGGENPLSMWRTAILNPVLDAQDRFTSMWESINLRISEILSAYDRETRFRYRKALNETRIKGVNGQPLTKWQLIMAVLNTGNASNLDKMLRGHNWNSELFQEVRDDHMSARDWQFVQQVWDLVGEFWPMIQEQERHLSGATPPAIEARTVKTPHGDFKGGYFPVAYDPEASRIAERNELVDLFERNPTGLGRAITAHGWVKERTDFAAPLLLDTAVLTSHLHDVAMDLAFRETLLDVQKILSRDDVNAALEKKLGRDFNYRQFWLPWLQAIAGTSVDPARNSAFVRVARGLRLNMTMFKLVGRASTLFMQVGGNLNGYRRLVEASKQGNRTSARYWLQGAWRSMRHGDLTVQHIFRESPFMRNRVRSYDRDVKDITTRAQLVHGYTDQVRDYLAQLIGRMQLRFVDVPLWIAAREMSLKEMNLTRPEAQRFADSVVRRSQGAGEVLSQSAVMRRDNEFIRNMTMFYTYNSSVYNNLRSAGRGISVRSVPSFMAAYAMYVIGPGIYAEFVRSTIRSLEGRDEPEMTEARMAAMAADILVGDAAATIPMVRDIWGVVIANIDPKQGFRSDASAAIPMTLDEINRIGGLIGSGEADQMMLAFARSAGVLTGVPPDWILSLLESAAKEK